MKKIFLIVLLAIGFKAQAQQDPQYTMYMFNQLALNPAYAGSRGCLSATAHYRIQWVGVAGAPKTLSFGVHSPLHNERVSLGFQVVNDQLGVTNMTNIAGSYAYRIPITEKIKLAAGLQASISNYTNDLVKAANAGVTDKTFSVNESLILPNFGAGLYLNSPNSYIGVTVPHIVNNKLVEKTNNVVTEEQARQFRHLFVMAGTVIKLTDALKLKPSGIMKFAPHAPIEYDGNLMVGFYDALWLGATWRSDVSNVRDKLTESLDFIALYEINKKMRIGVAYDQTFTNIRTAQKGTYEFLVGYDFLKDPDRMVTPRYF